eukprot:CAMPEP_0197613694 /NCGR_PEP_ID=MMETSP1326-20131121/59148_1 /TAXON_ID=1155430 /ORGANISM="Genus nov. species nov., Strain RCC2288" /LENGTH=771 /DNA_ID=CAMNT_0043182559 /DNA_START=957 /DNA_END=3272 /DNA_ORIENTATION=+
MALQMQLTLPAPLHLANGSAAAGGSYRGGVLGGRLSPGGLSRTSISSAPPAAPAAAPAVAPDVINLTSGIGNKRTYTRGPAAPRGGQRSAVWNYMKPFSPPAMPGNKNVECFCRVAAGQGVKDEETGAERCGKLFSYNSAASLSNLQGHMKKCHQVEAKAVQDASAHSAANTERRAAENCNNAGFQAIPFSASMLPDAVRMANHRRYMLMTAADLRPGSMNLGAGHRLFVAGLEPRYLPQCHPQTYNELLLAERDSLTARLTKTFEAHIASFPKDTGPVIALQTDLWTSTANESYGAITCSWIDTSFNMQRACLAVRGFPGSHAAVAVGPWIAEVCRVFFGFTPPNQIFICATVDQGQNIVNALRDLLHIPVHLCDGHRLNTIVCWALGVAGTVDRVSQAAGREGTHLEGTCKNKGMRDFVGRVAASVAYFTTSPQRNGAFLKIQEDMGEDMLEQIKRNDTRWSSTANMFKRKLRLRVSERAYFGEHEPLSRVALNDSDYVTIQHTMGLVSPAAEVNTAVQGADGTLLSVSMSHKMALRAHLEGTAFSVPNMSNVNDETEVSVDSLDELALRARDIMAEEMDTRRYHYANTVEEIMCCMLDPQLKDDTNLKGMELGPAYLRGEYDRMRALEPDDAIVLDDSSEEQGHGESPAAKRRKPMSFLEKQSLANSAGRLQQDDEVSLYLMMRPTPIRGETSLDFWRKKESELPILAKVARRFLGIDATSCEPERVFSAAGMLVTALRSRLLPWKVEAMMFLHLNAMRIPDLAKFYY